MRSAISQMLQVNVGSSTNKEVARSQNFNVISKIMKRKYNMNSRAKRHDVKKF